jgi:hypothetical protein
VTKKRCEGGKKEREKKRVSYIAYVAPLAVPKKPKGDSKPRNQGGGEPMWGD